MRLSLTFASAMLVLAGCASTDGAERKPTGIEKYADDPRLGEEVDRICFANNIDSFGNNTRDTFTVREGRDHYLIEVFGTCTPLEHAVTMRIGASTGCLTNGDSVIVSDSLTIRRDQPFSTARCVVKSMHKWDPKAEKADDTTDTDSAESDAPPEES
ncbi:DUF6491 family protein [Hyphomonas sp.]|uniref:DUF6491 family protein n=1 Tax=Hyphomonas sp. TaxID=87 RepID=UPI00352740E3